MFNRIYDMVYNQLVDVSSIQIAIQPYMEEYALIISILIFTGLIFGLFKFFYFLLTIFSRVI